MYDKSNMSPVVAVSMSDYSMPQLKETHTKDFVTNGEKNEYFRFLIDLSISSPTNRAIIDTIFRNTYGKGLSVTKEVEKPAEEDASSKGLFGAFTSKMFSKKQAPTMMDKEYVEEGPEVDKINDLISPRDLKAIVKDRIILGQAAVKVIYKGAGTSKKMHKIKHFPVQTLAPKKISVDKVRKEATKKDKDDYEFKGEVEGFYYHPRWEDYKEGDKLTEIPAYGYGKNIEIYVIKDYWPNYWYWNPVDYSGGVKYALIEKEIADFLVTDVTSGFSPTTIINIQRDFESFDKREQLISDFKSRMSGSKGDRTLFQFNTSEAEATTFDQLEPIPTDKFSYIATECARKLAVSWRVDAKYIGLATEGESGLGNNAKEIEVSHEKFQSTVVELFQDEILEALRELFKINGIEDPIEFIPVSPLDFEKHSAKDGLEQTKFQMDQNPEEGYNDKKSDNG